MVPALLTVLSCDSAYSTNVFLPVNYCIVNQNSPSQQFLICHKPKERESKIIFTLFKRQQMFMNIQRLPQFNIKPRNF